MGAVIVTVRRMVVTVTMAVIVTVLMCLVVVAVRLVRRLLGNNDRRVVSVAVYAVWLVVNRLGLDCHGFIIVPPSNIGGVAGVRRA